MSHRPNSLVPEHPRSALGTAGLRGLDWAPRQRPHCPLSDRRDASYLARLRPGSF